MTTLDGNRKAVGGLTNYNGIRIYAALCGISIKNYRFQPKMSHVGREQLGTHSSYQVLYVVDRLSQKRVTGLYGVDQVFCFLNAFCKTRLVSNQRLRRTVCLLTYLLTLHNDSLYYWRHYSEGMATNKF